MSDISKKDLLHSIKKSVENEAPDVWENIKSTEECKYAFEKKPLSSKKRKAYLPLAAAACLIVVFVSFQTKFIKLPGGHNEFASDSIGQNKDKEIIAPGVPEIAAARDSIGSADIFKPFGKDADAKEAAAALKIEIAMPTWLPDGFNKISAKLLSSKEDFSNPYMYNIEYKNSAGKALTLGITKYMTEEDKLKSQPDSTPQAVSKGADEGNTSASDRPVSVPSAPADAPSQSKPGYNSSEPATPPVNVDKPSAAQPAKDLPQSSASSGGSTGSRGTASNGKEVSVDFSKVKINETDVSLTVTSSSENGTVSAFWVYHGSNYNLFSDGISKDDMIKVVKSIIK